MNPAALKFRLRQAGTSDRLRCRESLYRQIVVRPTCKTIIAMVAEHYDLRTDELTCARRYHYLIAPRRMACVVCHRILSASTCQIGRALNRDHSTIVHHLAQAKKPDFDEETCASIVEKINLLRRPHPVDNAHNLEKTCPPTNEQVQYNIR